MALHTGKPMLEPIKHSAQSWFRRQN